MRGLTLLSLAAASTAFVQPDPQVFASLQVQQQHSAWDDTVDRVHDFLRHLPSKAEAVIDRYSHRVEGSLNDALNVAKGKAEATYDTLHDSYFDTERWLQTADELDGLDEPEPPHPPHPPHHGPHPPHDGPGHRRPPHHGPPGKHHKSNLTVYQLIAESKYTTKLAALINELPDLVEALNGTKANYTVFAPTDAAFDKIPDHVPKPTKEQLQKLLSYHVSDEFYPAGRILVSRTVPSLLESAGLGGQRQRISTNLSLFKALSLNFYARVIAVDIFGTNGVIHGIDSILLPPPSLLTIIDLLPGEFSTLNLGLEKTGLAETLNKTEHAGATFFAPSNWAFRKLGPRANAFLFSRYGQKYLKALLEYHVSLDHTLYSDAYYEGRKEKDLDAANVPKGHYHAELPTLLDGKALSIDVGRFGRLISVKINGFTSVSTLDGVARDGVLHTVSSVIIPPRTGAAGELEYWDGETELSEEELIERLEPLVDYESMDL